MELQELINNISNELNTSEINKQRKRYLESYIQELIVYQDHNPSINKIPSSFELFCDLNPQAPECIIYDL